MKMWPPGVKLNVFLTLSCCLMLFAGAQRIRRRFVVSRYGVLFRYTSNNAGIFLTSASSNATSSDQSDYISGTNLWTSELFASKNPTGAGSRAILSRQLLSPRQASTPVRPGSVLRFDTNIDPGVDISALVDWPYICQRLTKNRGASPDFQFIGNNSQNYIHLCRSIRQGTLHLEQQQNQDPRVYFSSFWFEYAYGIQSHPSRAEPSVHITQVRTTAETYPTSDPVRENDLIQLELFMSPRKDGLGPRFVLSDQLLNRVQASQSLGPAQRLSLTSDNRFDVTNFGPGTAYAYICVELSANPASDVEFHFGESRRGIACNELNTDGVTVTQLTTSVREVQQGNATYLRVLRATSSLEADITYQDAQIYLSRPDSERNEARADVNYLVRFGDNVPAIEGDGFWRLLLVASEDIEGTGRRRILSEQMLNAEQISTAPVPGRTITFRTTESFDIQGIGRENGLPFICVVFTTHQRSPIEIAYEGKEAITTCQVIPDAISTMVEETPRADAHSYRMQIRFQQPSRHSTIVDADVTFFVTFRATSDIVLGGSPNWQLRLFASEREDGYGRRADIASQLLDDRQMVVGVGPLDSLRFTGSERFDIGQVGRDNGLPFICVSLEEHPGANFELNFEGRDAVVSCEALPTTSTRPDAAEITYQEAQIRLTRPDPRRNEALADVTYVVRFGEVPPVEGDAFWQLLLLASEDSDGSGRRRVISDQILGDDQISAAPAQGRQYTFTTGQRFDVRGLGQENGLPYICLIFTKHQQSPIEIAYEGQNLITTCELIPADISTVVEEIPRAVPYSYRMQIAFQKPHSSPIVEADVTYRVTFAPISDVIPGGSPNWQLGLFASENEDGTGRRATLSTQLLDSRQTSVGARPYDLLTFTATESFNSRQVGRDNGLPYICLSMEKHPDADFELIFKDREEVVGCREFPIFDTVPRAEAQNVRMYMNLQQPYPYSPTVNADIDYLVAFSPTSTAIQGGVPLWNLQFFASERRDGSGRNVMITPQLLDDSQASRGVFPGQSVRFTATESFDFTELGRDNGLPYICVALEKEPDADIELVYNSADRIVSCDVFPVLQRPTSPSDGARPVPVNQYNTRISYNQPDTSGSRMSAYIQYALRFGDFQGEPVSGDDLWLLQFFASQSPDGSGPRFEISPQVLDDTTMSAAPRGSINFDVTTSFDAADFPRSGYLYGCASFLANPAAGFEIVNMDTNAITVCELLPTYPEQPPRAVADTTQFNIILNQMDPASPFIDSEITYLVTFQDTSDVVDADTPLWNLRLMGSERPDGTGRLFEISPQILDRDQTYVGVTPSGQIEFTADTQIDSTNLGPDSYFPYICVLLERNLAAEFELVFGDRDVVLDCRPFPSFRTLPIPIKSVTVQSYRSNLRFTQADSSLPVAQSDIVYYVLFHSSSDEIIGGRPLWQLRLFASEFSDGSGEQREISPQILDPDQESLGVGPGEQLVFSSDDERFDFTGIGRGTQFPYICLTLQLHPDTDADLYFRNGNSVTGCEVFPLRSPPPRVEVDQQSVQLTVTDEPVTTVDVAYLLRFTDWTHPVQGDPLWQLRLFASQREDGKGPEILLSPQILDEDQASYSVTPGGEIQFTLLKGFDTDDIDPGYPYICTSLGPHPSALMEFISGEDNSITVCEPLEPVPQRAPVDDYTAQLVVTTDSSVNPPTTTVRLIFHVNFSDSAEVIDSPQLWQVQLYTSQYGDGTGPQIVISPQVLIEDQESQGVTPGGGVTFEHVKSFDTGDLDPDFPYVCMSLMPHPDANFYIISEGNNFITSCEPFEQPKPQALVENYKAYIIVSTNETTIPPSTQVNFVYNMKFADSADHIESPHMWRMRFFASQNENGTGQEIVISPQILEEDQESQTVSPEGEITFEHVKSFDPEGINPDFPYVCTSLLPHEDATFDFVTDQGDAITTCEPFDVSPLQAPVEDYIAQITLSSDDGRETPTTAVNVVHRLRFSDTADDIEGSPLWQLKLYLSQNEDGTAPDILLSQQILDEDQVSESVTPGGEIAIENTIRLNADSMDPEYPYVCTSLTKHPEADFEFSIGGENAIVTCEKRDLPLRRAPAETYISQISLSEDNSQDTPTTTVDVLHRLRFSDTADDIEGSPLWQLKLFLSQSEDGTAPEILLFEQILDEDQISESITPQGEIMFLNTKSFTTEYADPEYPYVCTSLTKHPEADFEFSSGEGNAIVTCEKRDIPPPQAEVENYISQISLSEDDSEGTPTTTVDVLHRLGFSDSSHIVEGSPLWQLRLFLSQSEKGAVPDLLLYEQILDEFQISQGIVPRGEITFGNTKSFKTEDLDPEYPYVCTSLTKHPEADFDFSSGGEDAIVTCEKRDIPPPEAPVESFTARISLSSDDTKDTPTTTVDVTHQLRFSDTADDIEGSPLWQLKLFLSQSEDGTAPEILLFEQILDEDQISERVTPGGEITFENTKSFGTDEVDPEYPYVCTSLTKHPDAEFEFISGEGSAIVTCEEIELPLPQALVGDYETRMALTSDDSTGTPVFTLDIDYTLRFSNEADHIDSEPLWQITVFGSLNENGTGPSAPILEQVLDEDQTTQGVDPNGEIRFSVKQSFNVEGVDPSYPYICATLSSLSDAAMELIIEDGQDSITACQPLETQRPQAPLDDYLTSLVLTPDDDPETTEITANVDYLLRFSGSADNIDGDPLWQMRLFASENNDGTGPEVPILEQILDEEQIAQSIGPGEELAFTAIKSFSPEDIELGPTYSYICSSLMAHPDSGFEFLLDDGSSALVVCKPLPRETKTCRVWGDPHQKTFDGYGFSFQHEGQYIALQTCKDEDRSLPEFRVIEDLYRRTISKPITFIRELILEYRGVVYSIAHPLTSTVDGVRVTLPYSDDNGVKIHFTYPHQILTTNFGLILRLDDGHNGDITLPTNFMDKVCGVCGNFDMLRGNECHYKDGTSMRRRNEECKYDFVDEWLHWRAEPALYPEHIKDLVPCSEGSSRLAKAQQLCRILIDTTGPLASCHEFSSPDFFYDNCVFDLCQTLPSALFLCGGVESYIYDCEASSGGAASVGEWRYIAPECALHCEENMVFSSRGDPCPPTCVNQELTPPDECPIAFLESCQCVEGMVLDGDRCVPIEECGCLMESGRYLAVGEEYMSANCTESCTCDAVEGLKCSLVTCVADSVCSIKAGVRDCYCREGYTGNGREQCVEAFRTCRVYGDPHFNTFDDHFYSYQGACLYTAVRTCKALPAGVPELRIIIKNERLIPEERYTYVTMVQLRQNGKTYRVPYGGRISINGKFLGDSLPFVDSDDGIEISINRNSYVLKTDIGMEIAINGTSELTIKLPAVYYGKVCGLCGNADGDETNDKQKPNGELAKKLPFASAWSYGQCTQPQESLMTCEEGTDEYAQALDVCSVLIQKDGPFVSCHDYQDPTNYFKSCVYDLCGTLPDTSALCTSINQYVQACGEKGGDAGDWRAGVPLCVPITCENGYLPFRRSCYKLWRGKKNFRRSNVYCERQGGHMVTINSRAENDFVSEISRGIPTWIGAERNQSASFQTFESTGDDSYTFLPTRIPKGAGSIRFGISAASNAYVVLSPTLEPHENTTLYEIAIGTQENNQNSLRLCMDCDEIVSERRNILMSGEERRFYINFHGGVVRVGRRSLRDVNLYYKDTDPFRVKYIGFKTVGVPGSWKFYDNEFKWITEERWSYDNYRFGEPSNYNDNENCLEINFDSRVGSWNDHFCNIPKPFVCEIEK